MFIRTVHKIIILGIVFGILPLTAHAQNDNWLPAPTGTYGVGRVSYHWMDEAREETATSDPDDKRELVVRVWYPADVDEDAVLAPYIEDAVGPMAEEWVSGIEEAWGSWRPDTESTEFQDYIGATTHTYLNVPVSNAEDSYPVLVFAVGRSCIPENYTTQMEELASHGYVIAGIVEPYMSGVTIFPDGRLVKGFGIVPYAADDISFVLDKLEDLNTSNDLFAGRLDLENVGALGVSRGGNAVVIAAEQDDRIQAVLSEDGEMPTSDIRSAFLFFTTGPQTPAGGEYYVVWVEGFSHSSFSEFPIAPDLWATNLWFGAVDGARAVVIIRAYVLAFFDKYLKGSTDTLLDHPSADFPEVHVLSKNIE